MPRQTKSTRQAARTLQTLRGTGKVFAGNKFLCDVRYSAFQYALLSALAVLPRNVLGAPAGFLADEIGWTSFYLVTFFTALPGL